MMSLLNFLSLRRGVETPSIIPKAYIMVEKELKKFFLLKFNMVCMLWIVLMC